MADRELQIAQGKREKRIVECRPKIVTGEWGMSNEGEGGCCWGLNGGLEGRVIELRSRRVSKISLAFVAWGVPFFGR